MVSGAHGACYKMGPFMLLPFEALTTGEPRHPPHGAVRSGWSRGDRSPSDRESPLVLNASGQALSVDSSATLRERGGYPLHVIRRHGNHAPGLGAAS